MKHHPDACPNCGFVWGQFQGHRYGYGCEQIAAHIWTCRRCRYVVKSYDPIDRHVARS